MSLIRKTSIVILLMGIFVAVNVFGDVCSANSIDMCKVKAGKNGKGDSIKFSGLLDAQEAAFIAAIGGTVIVIIEADDVPDLNVTTYTFPIEEDTLKKGKYKSTKVKSADKSDPVTSFKLDTSKGKMKFSGKNLNLTGLSCPITITIQIGDYAAEIVLDEDIVNGSKKLCPPELIVGAEDTISAAFSFSPGSPVVAESVAFTDGSSGAPISWLWDFGDGGTSTEQHPTHMFTEASSFTVTLTVSDGSSSDSVSRELTVEEADLPVVSLYPVVDSGQTTCYNSSDEIECPAAGESFYGQDAQYDGNQPSYTDNNDGTVIDNITGLMWQQSPDTDGDGVIDADDKMSYDEAVAGARSQDTGGYTDWRLPTIKELYSLIDFSGFDPSGYEGTDTSGLIPFIDSVYFDFAYGDTDAGERIIDSQWATSTKYVATTMNGNETMFGVNFADGRIKGYSTTSTFFVVYVRDNVAYGINDFEDNGDGTITDHATGLIWMQVDSGDFGVGDNSDGALTWQQALAWAEDQDYGGHSDWRLPNAKELQSIVDYTRSPSTTSSAAIDPLFSVTSIIDEGGGMNYPFYWTGTTHENMANGKNAAYIAFGEALGWMQSRQSGEYTLMDVHGAGAQRSDPKTGDPGDFPYGRGPQGDVIRIYNHVRCVRDYTDTVETADFSAHAVEIDEGDSISFTDESSGRPVSWSWEFEGGTPILSTVQNPTVTYSTGGSYAVTLTTAYADGSDSVTKTDFISVTATSGVYEGYMLLAPMQSYTTYLIDTDESVAKTWTSRYRPGNSAYLLEDGTLLRTGKVTNDNRFASTGGVGGIVEKIDWDSTVSWSYQIADNTECLHHDVAQLPNGNILMIAWEYKTSSEAIAAGRNPSLLSEGELWPDKIIEVDPTDDSIVWEWHGWDHLVQDYDSAKNNYGVVADHPELLDLNYVGNTSGKADWNHVNAVAYNAAFDQIIISSHAFDEFWVIDHSTTTAEAASHSGGTYGKGGDILYRWGNSETYGASGTHKFYKQHDAHWIASGIPGAGNILVFNNGQGRPEGDYSTVEEIVPDVNVDGSYSVTVGQAFGPISQKWIYEASIPTDFYGKNISGAQRLANGNTLICEGPNGYIFEVTYDGTIVWTYQNTDGTPVFRAYKYAYDYSGLSQL